MATAEQAQAVCAAIRSLIRELYGVETAEAIRIQYGGSVSPSNAAELFAQPDIDGALIGGVWGALIGFLFLNPLLGIVADRAGVDQGGRYEETYSFDDT